MKKTETIQVELYKKDYDFFTKYLDNNLKEQQSIDENGNIQPIPGSYGRYVTLAIRHYLMSLKKHEEKIDDYIINFLEYKEKDELKSIKIADVEILALEKFKTYIHDKYGTLEPFLGLELSQALLIYLEDQFINIWKKYLYDPDAVEYALKNEAYPT